MNYIQILDFIKIIFINVYVFYVYKTITNYKEYKIINIIAILYSNIVLAMIYTIVTEYTNLLIASLIVYFLYAFLISTVTKNRIGNTIVALIISLIIEYAIYIVSILLAGNIVYIVKIETNNYTVISIIIQVINILLLYGVLKIKRINKGINFLTNTKRKYDEILYITLIGGISFIILGLLRGSKNIFLNTVLLTGIVLVFFSLVYWLQSQITKHYKKNMRDRTISVQKAEIDEQTKLLEEVKAENLKLATAVHKYNHRLSSLELAMKSAISHNLNTEFAEELSVMLKDTEDLSNSFAKECDVAKCILPLTNVPSIDNMFKYMQDEASKCNINFDLKINESINDLIDNIIPKDMFETLLGDHLRDAIIAVNASDNSYKSILTTLGLVDGCYELSVYDTGIEFQIDTLLKLGKEQVTTHKDRGGSGIGFMTTFETLKTTKASLVIEEYSPETTNYTKSVSIRFDGKNQYRIYSYRADDIKKQNKEKRIIVKNIE